ncbi:MAG: phosphoribosylanthranilate isomerase [Lentisphaeria bacterium]|nr:phosphoribosylanthranilate isomerase [Lentisphaeria bacterium]
MRVKICGIKTVNELTNAVNAGADAVGFLVGQRYPSQDFIQPETAARLAAMLPPFVMPVLVTHLTDPDQIMKLIDRTLITTVQLHGGSTPEQVRPLHKYLEGAGKLILALHSKTMPGETLAVPEAFNDFVDAYLLDTFDPATGRVGGTGMTHNWQASAEFTAKSLRPVILAGGLSMDNVAEAVRIVRPFAVDVNSSLRPAGMELNLKMAAAFVRNAKNILSGPGD